MPTAGTCPIAIIQGTDEREKGIVQIKDMIEGRKQAAAIESNEEWRETRAGQFEVEQADLVAEMLKRLAEQKADISEANGDGRMGMGGRTFYLPWRGDVRLASAFARSQSGWGYPFPQ